jgi:hypothetical protein
LVSFFTKHRLYCFEKIGLGDFYKLIWSELDELHIRLLRKLTTNEVKNVVVVLWKKIIQDCLSPE